jgi:hypothetical protein
MIITDRLGATVLIDVVYVDHPAALEETAARLTRQVIETGEGVGAFIRPESVWVKRDPRVLSTNQFVMDAVWSPDPGNGVELRGGPADGEMISLHREEDGRPIELLRVPTSASGEFGLSATAEYTRAGIDSERDVWVYEYRP